MPLTLDQYAASTSDTRGLPWPAPPRPVPPQGEASRPDAPDGIKGVLWTVYGTSVDLRGRPEVRVRRPIFGIALDKTIDEFKMWVDEPQARPACEYMARCIARS